MICLIVVCSTCAVMQSRDPSTNVVLLEDAAAVLGVILASGCMGLTSLTGKQNPESCRLYLDCYLQRCYWHAKIPTEQPSFIFLYFDLWSEYWPLISVWLSQVTRTTTVWAHWALARCWAPSQPSSSTRTPRPCWDAPFRRSVCRSWLSFWRMILLWGP